MKALSFIHQRDQVVQKASDMSAADWQYQTHMKKEVFFHMCCYSFSQGWKSLYNTIVNAIKSYYIINQLIRIEDFTTF